MRSSRIIASTLALTAALALAGCSDDPAEFASPADGTASAQTQTGAPTDGAEASDPDSGGAERVTVDPGDVVAETSYPLPASDAAPDGGTVTVGVHSLRVEGQTMLLTLYFTPEYEGENQMVQHDMLGHVMQPVLNDRENLKQYVLLGDGPTPGQKWASYDGTANTGTAFSSGETIVWWGYYAAPEDDVETMALSAVAGAAELEIPVQR